MIQTIELLLVTLLSVLLATTQTPSGNDIKVSVVIPAFNEEYTIRHVVETAKKVSSIDQIIVVDDGSTDNTYIMASMVEGITLLRHSNNKGKGLAMKTGLKSAKNDIVLFLDADLSEIKQEQIEAIIQPIIDGEADLTKTKFKREAGRVTELTAKPLLNFFFPELSFEQPLSGQFAAIKSFLESIDFEYDYGVDIGIVLDADARGLRIKEVDIGNIVHNMSGLHELNIMATEVVRTIVDRAINYGRLSMMDDLGSSIRMELLGLTIIIFGIFGLFFIRFMTPIIAVIIIAVGVVISLWYLYRIIRMSIKLYRQSKLSRRQLGNLFIHMHFPVVISAVILLLLVGSILGSVSLSSNEVSIEPASKNIVISSMNTQNSSVDARGPYTIENALENEEHLIRLSTSALNSLKAQYGDYMYIDDKRYQLEQSLDGEGNLIRIPEDARTFLDVSPGDVIRDSDMNNLLDNTSLVKNIVPDTDELQKQVEQNGTSININTDTTNMSVGTEFGLHSQPEKRLLVFVNDTLVGTTSAAVENSTYSVYINGQLRNTLNLNESSEGVVYNTTFNNSTKIDVMLENTEANTTTVFANDNSDVKFLNIHINENVTGDKTNSSVDKVNNSSVESVNNSTGRWNTSIEKLNSTD